MNRRDEQSIFAQYYQDSPFVDRYDTDRARGVDVVVPIIHASELWRVNLLSVYREIPVCRLIIGDGGCIDGSVDVARGFPRVEVHDHRALKSLGFSIRRLIEETTSEWFVYLHSDVYLPEGWFDAMYARREDFEWYECPQRITVLADYLFDTTKIERAYSGTQMGRRAALISVLPQIDDDYLYRNEDIVIAHLVKEAGLRYGKVGEIFHYHQVMHKPSRWRRDIRRVDVQLEIATDEDIRANFTYLMGIAKYVPSDKASEDIVNSMKSAIDRLVMLGTSTRSELLCRLEALDPSWRAKIGSIHGRDDRADLIVYAANVYRNDGIGGVVAAAWRAVIRDLGAPSPSGRRSRWNFVWRMRNFLALRAEAFANGFERAGWASGWSCAFGRPIPVSRQSERFRTERARKIRTLSSFFRDEGLFSTLSLLYRKAFRRRLSVDK